MNCTIREIHRHVVQSRNIVQVVSCTEPEMNLYNVSKMNSPAPTFYDKIGEHISAFLINVMSVCVKVVPAKYAHLSVCG